MNFTTKTFGNKTVDIPKCELYGKLVTSSEILSLSLEFVKKKKKKSNAANYHLCLSHAVQVQISPVGNIGQQVTVIHWVTVQVHTLCLYQNYHICGQAEIGLKYNSRI